MVGTVVVSEEFLMLSGRASQTPSVFLRTLFDLSISAFLGLLAEELFFVALSQGDISSWWGFSS
jgi:uncharacterized membrane protein